MVHRNGHKVEERSRHSSALSYHIVGECTMIIEFIEQHWPISLVASIFLFQFLAFLYELISDKSAEAKANQRKIDLEKEYQQRQRLSKQ